MSRTVSVGIFSYGRSEEPPSLRFFLCEKAGICQFNRKVITIDHESMEGK